LDKLAPPRDVSAESTAMAESDRLRRCMKDILTVTTLPTIWIGRDLDYIGKTLLEVVGALMNVDFMVLRIASREGKQETRITWFGNLAGVEDASGFRDGLESLLGDVAATSSTDTRVHWAASTFSYLIEKLDANGANGTLVAGSRSLSFPDEHDQALLRVAATQASSAIGGAIALCDKTKEAVMIERNRIVDAVPVMAWSSTPDGSADYFNMHFLAFLGITKDQALG
jgi:hypothetical protein